ncbi:MAG: hypothetical protein J0H25_01005 [Rhizobiales bacterium]|nr:hypothetical protein [Hyphomicrobiales bacterium]MBN9011639.1 hypothetical protein [Hyphomicrobiales bacterium]
MANERDPNDPFRPAVGNEPLRDARPLDNELQADPEMAEGPASGTRIALYAVAAAVILGAVFYGLNNSETTTTATTGTTTPTAQTTAPQSTPKADRNMAEQSKPPVAPGVRDVTPYNNQPGTTTGAAPAQPQSSPPPASDGSKAKQ